MNIKYCIDCKEWKPISDFNNYKTSKDGKHYYCKICSKKRKKKYYENDKEYLLSIAKEYYQNNKEKCIKYNKKYNIKLKIFQPWYFVYVHIKTRCENIKDINYKYYGGRGIKCNITKEEIKKLWFECCAWRLKRPSIDRIDVNGNYEYSNCRFIEQGENSKKARNKPILQYDKQGNFIKEWNSGAEASKKLNILLSHINECCHNKRKSAYGFIWKFKK